MLKEIVLTKRIPNRINIRKGIKIAGRDDGAQGNEVQRDVY